MIEAIVYCPKARLQSQVFSWVVIRKTLWIILCTKAPWEAIVQSLANPIELIRVVSIRAIVYCKQVAVRRERHIVGIACAARQDQSLFGQSGLVVRQNQFGGACGYTQDPGGEATSRVSGKTPPLSCTSPWSVREPPLI